MLKTVLGKIPCWVESRQSGVDVYWLSYSLIPSVLETGNVCQSYSGGHEAKHEKDIGH